MFKQGCLLFFVFWLLPFSVLAGSYSFNNSEHIISQQVYWQDRDEASYEASEIYNLWQQGQSFRSLDKQVLASGLNSAPVWVGLELYNAESEAIKRHLLLDTSWLDEVHFYQFYDGQLVKQWITGDNHSALDRTSKVTGFLMPLYLEPGKTQVLVQLDTPDPLVAPFYVVDDQKLDHFTLVRLFSYGLVYGYLLALIFFNTALSVGIRDRRHLLYAFYLLSFVVANFSYTGHGFVWVWSQSVEWQRWAQPLLMMLFGSAGLWFATVFLDIRSKWLALYRFSSWILVGSWLVLLFSYLTGNQALALMVAFAFMLIFTSLMLIMGVFSVLQGSISGRFYLTAVVAGTLGTIVTTMAVLGWLPFSELTFRAAEIGMLLEATLLALALASRIRRVQHKQVLAEKDANTDALTLLNNRRALYYWAEGLWKDPYKRRQPLCALIMDIDHFKECNDAHGHMFGDQVLQMISKLLNEKIRKEDMVARWGGEEFIVLLPNTQIEEARQFAERFLQQLREQKLINGEEAVSVTASIGLATGLPEQTELDDLILRADEALYQAKQSGRDQVICILEALLPDDKKRHKLA
ncbi:diguanylate cyclase [Thiomicrospira pelophila]|uniref:diguanylate cyclase n=1 Tax=Thiomicrospira pelophila TaxID=934 RepID=UPI00068CC307|nr:diguanylate cyclase [Thiomicrospira pelophila]